MSEAGSGVTDLRLPSIDDVVQVASILRDAGIEAVFIGGLVVPLFLGPEGRARARATEDIDVVVDADSFPAWTRTEAALRRLGFRNEVREGAPMCRFLWDGLTIDVVPVAPQFLGMSDNHLRALLAHAEEHRAERGVFSIPTAGDLFAAKAAAFFDRGAADPYLSEDLEDLVALLDDCDELEASIAATQDAERNTIAAFLQWLEHHPYRDELIDGNVVGRGATRPARSRRLWLRIGSLVEMLR